MKKRLALSVLFAGLLSRSVLGASAEVEQKVQSLLKAMTPAEKITLLAGIQDFYTRPVDRVGLPRFKFTDGPVGTRNDGKSTAYPAGCLLAATWDPALAEREGKALGHDARVRGDNVLLGPGTNIYRQPQNGRNFEYMGEDPYLAGKMDVGYIVGLQGTGVAACVKHYACNNQEINRGAVDVKVDERTLHEIYLPAFEASIKEGHARSIMASYNRINGDYATANHYLLTEVLRDQWHFDGLAMSDWGAVHETVGVMNAGLDLEMPGPEFLSPKKVQAAIDAGTVKAELVDQKVERLLRIAIEMGWMDRPQKIEKTDAGEEENDQTALAVARAGIVLLKNENQALPLDPKTVKNVVLCGPGADRYVGGGGSSYTQPAKPVTLAQGMEAAKFNTTIVPFVSWETMNLATLAKRSTFDKLAGAYFNTPDLTGEPAVKRDDARIDFNWKRDLPMAGVTTKLFSARWTGKITATEAGEYFFITRSDDGSRVKLDGKTIVDNWRDQQAHTEHSTVHMNAGQTAELTVEYYNSGGEASMQFAWGKAPDVLEQADIEKVRSADAVVIAVRTFDTEGDDHSYDLQARQVSLIKAAEALNKRCIVVLYSGGNVAMADWIDGAPAVVDAFFPGQAGGKAIAEILAGDVNPSGHLPDTFEKQWADSPAYGHYPGGKTVEYAEGIYVGYRWYDKKQIEPRFPFGFGLSYTSFELKNLRQELAEGGGGRVIPIGVDVTNTGQMAGATVVQMYVRPPAGEDRAVQELKGFRRVELKPGETKHVELTLTDRSFAEWDVGKHEWKVTPGQYEIAVGRSSRDICGTVKVAVK